MKTVSRVAPKLFILLTLALGAASGASAQATRTWVSGVGDDANPCSRTAPCKTFAGAISKTAACGEINALDPGGFGAVTITKPITIDGRSTNASILASSTNGINIDMQPAVPAGCPAGARKVVTLRNLSINGAGTTPGVIGIRALDVDELHVENVDIFGFRSGAGNGISFTPATGGAIYLSNVNITNNLNHGIFVQPAGGNPATVILKNVNLNQNNIGMLVMDNVLALVTESVASGNAGIGFQAASATLAKIQLDRTIVANNGLYGVRTDGAGAVIRLSGSTIIQNSTGISMGGGTVATFGNNTIAGNLPNGDGASNLSFPLK